jgi:acid phosphatase (class A)
MLLRRSLADAGLSTYAAKDKYQVVRPFVKLAQATCSSADEVALARDGSYPSGHAAVGWAWGLILTELAPERSQALLERATAFGQSRAVCAVHWKSDIDAGQLMASAAVAKLHGNADFLAQLGAARAEIAQTRAQGSQPNRDCAAEANALALDRPVY